MLTEDNGKTSMCSDRKNKISKNGSQNLNDYRQTGAHKKQLNYGVLLACTKYLPKFIKNDIVLHF